MKICGELGSVREAKPDVGPEVMDLAGSRAGRLAVCTTPAAADLLSPKADPTA